MGSPKNPESFLLIQNFRQAAPVHSRPFHIAGSRPQASSFFYGLGLDHVVNPFPSFRDQQGRGVPLVGIRRATKEQPGGSSESVERHHPYEDMAPDFHRSLTSRFPVSGPWAVIRPPLSSTR